MAAAANGFHPALAARPVDTPTTSLHTGLASPLRGEHDLAARTRLQHLVVGLRRVE